MIKNVLLGLYFWILMTLTLVMYLPYLVLRKISKPLTKRYLLFITRMWARHVLWVAGVKLNVRGKENIPSTDRVAFVTNHQGYFDIPILMNTIPKLLGFIAKAELGKVPIVNMWMKAIGCIFIERKKASESLNKSKKRIEQAQQGEPVVLFPEGTRSKGPHLGRFKTGSLQILFSTDLMIVPVSISGSYRLLEEKNKLRSGTVHITFHPPIHCSNITEQNAKDVAHQLRNTIQDGLLQETS
ncbi:MAG: lysophospholipid acyltransferase family protein [Bacteroidales bacterium]